MQGQQSPLHVKDLYTGSILMHVGSSCKHNGSSVQCTPPKNNKKLIDGSNKKKKVFTELVCELSIKCSHTQDVCAFAETTDKRKPPGEIMSFGVSPVNYSDSSCFTM